jgi:bla regulator protein BlaR1
MNSITYHLSSPVIYALGWTLFHALWQGFALVLSTALLLHTLRSQSSVVRYRVGVIALLAQVVASVGTFGWYYRPIIPSTPTPDATLPMRSFAIHWQTVSQTLPWHKQIQFFLDAHLSQFVLIYLIGVALFGLRLTGGWLYLQHLSRTATQPVSDRWWELANRLRSTLLIRSIVQVRESARIAVPMVVGTIKPVLLLPIGLATNLSMREIEAVLAHELAHVKRHDYAVNLLQSVMEVLYFFHPAIWWLSARVREEREHCCDDLAVEACGGDGRTLAQALARVEELRLVQSSMTPSLAMALTTKRQLLLHRVRRMLGVPTRPVVSNGSLAGLTLATLLLVSASVYAIQQQPKPRHKQPQATRKHKIDSNSEYGMVDSKKVSYVIWKGQKLPAARVARLQRQLDQVETGQLSLDNIPQSDRDILLTIIEKNNGFDSGMNALSEGLAHIDYDNIAVSAETGIETSLATLNKINYDNITNQALASLSQLQPLSDSLDRLRTMHQGQIDSLSRLMALQAKQMEALHRQMEKLQFPIEEFGRNQETLEWRKQRLMEERQRILEKRQQILNSSGDGKGKVDPATIEKQLEQLEPEIKKQELGIGEVDKQLEEAREKLETTRQPMEKLEREAEQLDRQMEKLSREMSKYSESMARISLDDMDHSGFSYSRSTAPARLFRAPRAPRALRSRLATPAAPAVPPVHVSPVPAPAIAPVPSIAPAPARSATPRAVPKVAPAPKRNK